MNKTTQMTPEQQKEKADKAAKEEAIKAWIAAEKAKPEYILEQKKWLKRMKKDKKALENEGEEY